MGDGIEGVAPLHARRRISQLDGHGRVRHFVDGQGDQNNGCDSHEP